MRVWRVREERREWLKGVGRIGRGGMKDSRRKRGWVVWKIGRGERCEVLEGGRGGMWTVREGIRGRDEVIGEDRSILVPGRTIIFQSWCRISIWWRDSCRERRYVAFFNISNISSQYSPFIYDLHSVLKPDAPETSLLPLTKINTLPLVIVVFPYYNLIKRQIDKMKQSFLKTEVLFLKNFKS